MNDSEMIVAYHPPLGQGKAHRPEAPLKLRQIWALRTRREMAGKAQESALFNLAIDSKLRGCGLVQLRVDHVARGGEVLTRASVVQQKTREPVRFELTEPTRIAVSAWIAKAGPTSGSYLFPSRQPGAARHFFLGGGLGDGCHRALGHGVDAERPRSGYP